MADKYVENCAKICGMWASKVGISMKNKLSLTSLFVVAALTSTGCTVEWKVLEAKSKQINNYEKTSIVLARENRELITEVNRMKFEIEKLRQENIYYKNKVGEAHAPSASTHEVADSHGGASHESTGHDNSAHGETAQNDTHVPTRSVASIGSMNIKKDQVEYEIYKWKAEDMHKIAESEFKKKNFEKAAQFYYSIIKNYPKYTKIDDDFYFKAGVSAFETGEHHEWALVNFEYLMASYPTSKYYRSAKLWSSLTHLKMGDKKKFFITVEEFRKKYRNSPEWKILSAYYEKIEEKTHE